MSAQDTRACGLCVYHKRAGVEGDASCWHPRVTRARGPVSLAVARSQGEACGPRAVYLNIPGWSPSEIERMRSWGT